jgi:hypothetical protein
MNSKRVCDLFTDFFTTIICIAVMQPVFFFEPSPCIFCHNMIAKDNRGSGCRKETGKKNSLSVISSDEMGIAQAAQQG